MAVKTRYSAGRPTNYQRAVAGFLNDIASELVEFLVINKRIATGESINDFVVDVREVRGGSISQLAELEAAPHIAYALGGRNAGKMPPVDAIAAWIEVKGLDLNAYAVAKTIAALGTEGPHLRAPELETAINLSFDKWGERMALGQAEELADKIVNDFVKRGYKKQN